MFNRKKYKNVYNEKHSIEPGVLLILIYKSGCPAKFSYIHFNQQMMEIHQTNPGSISIQEELHL